MKYDFKTLVNRKNKGSLKWEQMAEWNPNTKADVIPLSVADMELKNPPEIYQGLAKFLQEEPILGYTKGDDTFYDAVVNWQKKRHHWEIQKEWIVNTPGVVSAFYVAVKQLTNPGDGVIIFRPVYYPFGSAISDNSRQEVNVPLIANGLDYEIDFEAFEKAAQDPKNKLLIFCSPHNPVGRVWKKAELERLAKIAVENDLYVISDEIWYDLVSKEHPHTVLATVNPQLNSHLITCTAPSKSFNLAGMMTSNIIISDETLRNDFITELAASRSNLVNALGYQACKIAYNECEPWLDEVNELITHNMEVVTDFFAKNYPVIKTKVMEGTYLQWIDFRGLGLTPEELETFLHEKAEFFTDEGYVFGEEGAGFERVNVACPTAVLEKMLDNLLAALKTL